MSDQATLEGRCINTIRFLAADAIQKANSGHPGMPMGAYPVAAVSEAQPRSSRLGGSRPLCPLWWTRINAPVRITAPDRL